MTWVPDPVVDRDFTLTFHCYRMDDDIFETTGDKTDSSRAGTWPEVPVDGKRLDGVLKVLDPVSLCVSGEPFPEGPHVRVGTGSPGT